jgi:tetratricopeptide (TPR) repeat protein
MKSILGDTKLVLEEFLDDPVQNLLVVCTETEDSVLLLKTLTSIEEDPGSRDIFLMFGEEFGNKADYVGEVIAHLEGQISDVNGELAKRSEHLEGLPAWVSDSGAVPEQRLFGALRHIRTIVPRDRKIVWLFFPLGFNGDTQEFVELFEFAKLRIDDPGLPGCKLIVRDVQQRLLCSRYNNEQSVRIYFPFLDLTSIRARLGEQSNDPAIPPDEQAQGHMLLAGFDVAEGRFDQALQRNRELLGYFYHTKQRDKQSVVLCNIGDIHYVQGRFPEAQSSYEKAVTIAAEEKLQPLIIYQSINLGNALMMQRKFDEAIVYYDAAEKLAEFNKAVILQVQALERMGDVKHEQGLLEEAIESWERGAEISRKHQYEYGLRSALEKLVLAYDEAGMVEEKVDRQRLLGEESGRPALSAAASQTGPPEMDGNPARGRG